MNNGEVYAHRSLETEGNAHHIGPYRERTRIGQQAEESEGREDGTETLLGFSQEAGSLNLSLNNFNMFGAIGVILSCLLPGPGMGWISGRGDKACWKKNGLLSKNLS